MPQLRPVLRFKFTFLTKMYVCITITVYMNLVIIITYLMEFSMYIVIITLYVIHMLYIIQIFMYSIYYNNYNLIKHVIICYCSLLL